MSCWEIGGLPVWLVPGIRSLSERPLEDGCLTSRCSRRPIRGCHWNSVATVAERRALCSLSQTARRMGTNLDNIAASFDTRAASYSGNEWHQRCAERLVNLCEMQPGQVVLDAGTGTGFAALAAAHAVGPSGRVCGVDVSAGMLQVARQSGVRLKATSVDWVQNNAEQLPGYADATFDVVTCAAALLYMSVSTALKEWHRLLKPGGRVAFSTMAAGSPLAARIFRDCAAAFGVRLEDPSRELGSDLACRSALQHAGFSVSTIVGETIAFSSHDLALAWESNRRSPAHADIERLSSADQERLRAEYQAALAKEERQDPGALGRAEVLYAIGLR